MQQSIKHIHSTLADIYSKEELSSIARLLISKVSGYTYTEIIVNKNTNFSQQQIDLIAFYLEKLKKGMPVQYVLGQTEFCGLDFVVDKAVLIPRPETEELVAWIAMEAKPSSVIFDIGTGSGCIAISLKSCIPTAEVYGCDISTEALEVARQNAQNNNQEISFYKQDILFDSSAPRKFNVIVSNPPYIPKSEIAHIQPQVKSFEPHQALFVEADDPLIFYRKIAEYAQKHLEKGGKLYFEVHRDYAVACKKMLEKLGFNQVVLKKDISGNDRMLRGEN